jgi:hypothetical protein
LGYEDLGRYRRAAGLARGRRPVWDRRPQRRRNNAAVNSPDAAEGLSADIPKFVLQKSENVISVKNFPCQAGRMNQDEMGSCR